MIILLLLVGYVWWRRWKYDDTVRDILCCENSYVGSSESVVKTNLNGTTKFSPNPKSVKYSPETLNVQITNQYANIMKRISSGAQTFDMRYVEINNTLGKGAYGKVKRGFISFTDFKYEVAVKSCTRPSGFEDIEREARVFLKLKERHMNIVNLLGK